MLTDILLADPPIHRRVQPRLQDRFPDGRGDQPRPRMRTEPRVLWRGDAGTHLPVLRRVQRDTKVETADAMHRPAEAVRRILREVL